jgi:Uma2 family endonuclease
VLLTPEQYLEIERQAERKSEYYAGEMFAMAGATATHNIIVSNILGRVHSQLESRKCWAFGSDMRVRATSTGLYTYPDISAVCGTAVFSDQHQDTLLNPDLIVEVLSPSTESYDRGRKFENYRTIASLSQYVLVASDRIRVDVYTREPNGSWMLRSFDSPGDLVELSSLDVRLTIEQIYQKTEILGAMPA